MFVAAAMAVAAGSVSSLHPESWAGEGFHHPCIPSHDTSSSSSSCHFIDPLVPLSPILSFLPQEVQMWLLLLRNTFPSPCSPAPSQPSAALGPQIDWAPPTLPPTKAQDLSSLPDNIYRLSVSLEDRDWLTSAPACDLQTTAMAYIHNAVRNKQNFQG